MSNTELNVFSTNESKVLFLMYRDTMDITSKLLMSKEGISEDEFIIHLQIDHISVTRKLLEIIMFDLWQKGRTIGILDRKIKSMIKDNSLVTIEYDNENNYYIARDPITQEIIPDYICNPWKPNVSVKILSFIKYPDKFSSNQDIREFIKRNYKPNIDTFVKEIDFLGMKIRSSTSYLTSDEGGILMYGLVKNEKYVVKTTSEINMKGYYDEANISSIILLCLSKGEVKVTPIFKRFKNELFTLI